MKHVLTALTAALLLIPSIAFGATVTARIGSKCAPANAKIVVPAGKTATGLQVVSLENGTKCTVGGKPDAKGWGVKKGGTKVYHWTQFRSNPPSEVGGKLSGLSLPAGTYEVFVDGGAGAKVTIKYDLK